MRLNVLQRLQQQQIAPTMTSMQPGAMSIAFGREENPEPVLGYINTPFGKVVIVDNMSAEMLISEFTSKGSYIIKDNTTLAIIHDNKLVLYGTRKPNSPAGTNEQLWMAAVEDIFQSGKQLVTAQHVKSQLWQCRTSWQVLPVQQEQAGVAT